MANSIRVGVALGLVLLLLASLCQLVWAQDIVVDIQGQASDGSRVKIAAQSQGSAYSLQLRAIDSEVMFTSSMFLGKDEMSNDAEYVMAGWWNQLSEKVGMRNVTSSKFEELASAVDMIGRAIVGEGEASAGLDYLSHAHQAQGIGQAIAGFAYIDAEQDNGNLTVTQNQGRLTFEGSWSMNYMLETMAPVGAEEEEFDWWGSICQGVTGWTMPELSGEGQWLR